MDEKKHKEKVITQCKGLSTGVKDKKKCVELVLDCHMNKCKDELIKLNTSEITEEESKQCEDKFKDNWKQKMQCTRKIMKKNGFFEASAKAGYCTANKCPEVFEYVNTKMKEIIENIHKDSKYLREKNECMQKECPKELEAKGEIPSIIQIANECNKKYNTASAQSTCLSKGLRPAEQTRKKYSKCLETHCKKDKDNKQTKTKSTKKQTKKNTN